MLISAINNVNDLIYEREIIGVKERAGHPWLLWGISPQSCTETDFEMKTSNFVLFLLISVVSVHFRAIYDETIRCQA